MTYEHCSELTKKPTVWVMVWTLNWPWKVIFLLGLCMYAPPMSQRFEVPHLTFDSLLCRIFLSWVGHSLFGIYRIKRLSSLAPFLFFSCLLDLTSWRQHILFRLNISKANLLSLKLTLPELPNSFANTTIFSGCQDFKYCFYSLFYFPPKFHHKILIVLSLLCL